MSQEPQGREKAERLIASLLSTGVRTEGLTVGVLQELTEELTERGNQVQLALFRQLQQAYTSEGGTGISEADDAASRLGTLPSASSKQERQLARLAEQHRSICSRIVELEAEREFVQAAAAVQAQMEEFEHFFATGNFAPAAAIAAAALRDQNLNNEPEVMATIRGRASALTAHLAILIASCVTVDCSDSHRRQVAVVTDGGLGEAWEALQTLEQERGPLEELAHRLLEQVLLPLLDASESASVRSGEIRSEEGAVAVLDLEIGQRAKGAQPFIDVLLQSLRFVADVVLQKRAALVSQIGQELWPQLAHAYIEQRLQPHVPIQDAGWDAFDHASTSGKALEDAAADAGYIQSSASDAAVIHAFVHQAQEGFLRAKRLKVMEQARSLIMAPNYDTVSVGDPLPAAAQPSTSQETRENGSCALMASGREADGLNWGAEGEEGPLLSTGTFQISRTAEAVGALMRAALQKAADSGSPAVAKAMLLALRDVAALYAALPPVVHRQQLQIPQLAALFYSDCQHLAQQLLTLPHCFQPSLAALTTGQTNFLADALRLRAAGKACLDSQAQHQAREIRELLASADGFRRVHKAQRGISARKVVQQTLHALRRAGSQLRDVLPPAAFVNFSGVLLQAAATHIVGDLLAFEDISVEESEDLPRILEPLAQDAAATLAGPGKDAWSPQLLTRAIEEAAPGLAKLQETVAILGARLVDIREWWGNGRLRGHGFSAAEVCHLIEALFEDTDLRQEVLSFVAR